MTLNDEGQTVAETETPEPASLMEGVQSSEPESEVADEAMPHRVEDEKPAKEERPAWLDDKFAKPEDLAKSYDELQKKFSQGKHKAPDEYSTDVLTEAGYELDDPVVDTYLGWAKKYGVNQEAFDELAGAITQMSGENVAAAEADYKAEHEALGPNANEIIKSNVTWADGLVRKGIVSEDERAELNNWGGTAIGQRLMQKVRTMTGDMSKIPLAPVAEEQLSEADFTVEMQSRMADPRYQSDPAYRQKVENEFNRRYG